MQERSPLLASGTLLRTAPQLRRVRSTLLCSGLVELRARGLFEDYLGVLDKDAAPTILNAVAGTWLDLDVCLAHFAACDAVVSADVAFAIGGSSGKRVQQSALATLVRLATGAGASPWTIFANYERLWGRIFEGSRVTIEKAGPKDAILVYEGLPLARFAYFRHALRGTNDGALRLFATNLFVRELPRHRTENSMRYRVAWV